MTTLQTQTFDQLVQTQATAVQGGSSGVLVDFSIGSILRAVIEAASIVGMWLQGLILQLLASTRAATSIGAALDSWMADYGLFRMAATLATGGVTFARFTPTAQAIIPVGTIIQTADGTQQYQVIADTTQTAYSASLGGYVLGAGTASATATVQALTPGIGANVAAGFIATLGQSISGIDTVTNAAAFVNGSAAEMDSAFRARFVGYLASLYRATKAAVSFAVASIQQGMTSVIVENYTIGAVYQPGSFYVVVDDGSGAPPSSVITAAAAAVEAARPLGITYSVFGSTQLVANIAATITTGPGYVHASVAAIVRAAITSYIAALPSSTPLSFGRLMQVIMDASPGVSSYPTPTLTINGATADLVPTGLQAIVPGSVVVS